MSGVEKLGWNDLSLVPFPVSVFCGISRESPYKISSGNYSIIQHIFVSSFTSLIMLLIDIIGYPVAESHTLILICYCFLSDKNWSTPHPNVL